MNPDAEGDLEWPDDHGENKPVETWNIHKVAEGISDVRGVNMKKLESNIPFLKETHEIADCWWIHKFMS